MDGEFKMSKLERILVNGCNPVLYLMGFGLVPFEEICQQKERDYSKLINSADNDGHISPRIKCFYRFSICGNLAILASHVRKYAHYYD